MHTRPESQTVLQPPGAPVADVKARLQHDYEEAYPQLAEIIHLVIDEEEARAKELSFPQLFLPDLVAAHIEKLNLEPLPARHESTSAQRFALAEPRLAPATAPRTATEFRTDDPQLRAA